VVAVANVLSASGAPVNQSQTLAFANSGGTFQLVFTNGGDDSDDRAILFSRPRRR